MIFKTNKKLYSLERVKFIRERKLIHVLNFIFNDKFNIFGWLLLAKYYAAKSKQNLDSAIIDSCASETFRNKS